MPTQSEPLPAFLAEPSRIGSEISITGKWVPSTPGGRFRKSVDADAMLDEWEAIHQGARAHDGVLSTEINHAVGEDAVLVHHVFSDADALVDYFSTTATDHMPALRSVATPELHMVRGVEIPSAARDAIAAKGVAPAFGELLFGYVRDDYRQPNPETAVQVTAKWTCGPGDHLDELKYWWQRVGTDAYSLEFEGQHFTLRGSLLRDIEILPYEFSLEADIEDPFTRLRFARFPEIQFHCVGARQSADDFRRRMALMLDEVGAIDALKEPVTVLAGAVHDRLKGLRDPGFQTGAAITERDPVRSDGLRRRGLHNDEGGETEHA